MPPPNHQTGSASGLCATRKRTFMCTVGTYGLRGCSTSDTPIASKPRPASSGRAAVADGGRPAPATCEKFTPPRSSRWPSSIRQLSTTAAFGPIPGVAAKCAAVELLQPGDDARLQPDEVVLDCLGVHGARASCVWRRWRDSRCHAASDCPRSGSAPRFHTRAVALRGRCLPALSRTARARRS